MDREYGGKKTLIFFLLCSMCWLTSHALAAVLEPYEPPPKQGSPAVIVPEYKTKVNKFIEQANKLSPSEKAKLKDSLKGELDTAMLRNDWDQVMYYRDLLKGIK